MEDWVWWMIAAGGLAVGEIFTLGFFLGPIAIAATLTAIVSLAGGGLAVSWVVFIVASVGLRSRAAADRATSPAHTAQHSHRHRRARGGPRDVLERVDANGGQVKIGGETWSARAYDEDDTFEPGARVEVMKIDGATALVAEWEECEPIWPALIVLIVVAVVVLFTLSRAIRIVPQARAGIVERLGRYNRTLDAGLALVIPYVDRVKPLIDLRETVVSFPPQPVITEDNLVINIDTVIYFQVTDPKAATYEIQDFIAGIEQLTVTTLRNVIGGMTLEDTLTSRDKVSAALRHVLDEATGKWGIRVNRVELKAVDPPASIQEAMEKQMRAERDRRAAILTAEGVKQSQILTAEGEKQSAILRAEGQARGADPRVPGPVQGDRDSVRGHPPRRRRPEAARLPVPPGAAADRAGRVEQGLDHPERGGKFYYTNNLYTR